MILVKGAGRRQIKREMRLAPAAKTTSSWSTPPRPSCAAQHLTLVGVGLVELTGAAWPDPVAGFVISAFAIHEGKEAWEVELVEDNDDD